MALRPRNILSLCAGVGGLELGIQLALSYRGEAGRGICYVERECAAAPFPDDWAWDITEVRVEG